MRAGRHASRGGAWTHGEQWAVPLLSRLPSNRTMVIHRGLRGQDKQGVSGTEGQPKIVSAHETCYANHSTRAWGGGLSERVTFYSS